MQVGLEDVNYMSVDRPGSFLVIKHTMQHTRSFPHSLGMSNVYKAPISVLQTSVSFEHERLGIYFFQ